MIYCFAYYYSLTHEIGNLQNIFKRNGEKERLIINFFFTSDFIPSFDETIEIHFDDNDNVIHTSRYFNGGV